MEHGLVKRGWGLVAAAFFVASCTSCDGKQSTTATAPGNSGSGSETNGPPAEDPPPPEDPFGNASRITGVAPLFVFFEANLGDDAEQARADFHTHQVKWNFGDGNAGRWTVRESDRNTHTGPVAAHVFRTPGRYEVTAEVIGPDGATVTQASTIYVEDPDVVFAANKTICISRDGNFEGAPPGAEQITTTDLAQVQAQFQPGVRVLLRRGETWLLDNALTINNQGPGHFGSFGEGERPLLQIPDSVRSAVVISGEDPLGRDWRVSDLAFEGTGEDSAVLAFSGQASNVLLQNLTVRNVHGGFAADPDRLNFLNGLGRGNHDFADGVALVDIDLEGVVGGSGGNGIFIAARRFAFLGNRFVDSTEAEHVLRMPFLDRAVIAHNLLSRAATGKNLIKLHAEPYAEAGIGSQLFSERIQISDNLMEGTAGEAWLVTIGPQNGSSDERVRDVLVERNVVDNRTAEIPFVLMCQDTTVRNNLIFMKETGGQCMRSVQRGVEPNPRGNKLYNNTCHATTDNVVRAFMFKTSTDSEAFNNALVARSAGDSDPGPDNAVEDNVDTEGTVFASPDSSNIESYRPLADSELDNQGRALPGLFEDLTGRPRGDSPDVGALEN